MTTTRCGVRTIFLLNTQRSRSKDKIALFYNNANPLMNKTTKEAVDTKLISQKLDHIMKTTQWRWLHSDLLSKIDVVKADVEKQEQLVGYLQGCAETTVTQDKLREYHIQLDKVRSKILIMSNRDGDPAEYISDITADISACMASIENELIAANKLSDVQEELGDAKTKNATLELDLDKVHETLLQDLQKAQLAQIIKIQEDAIREKTEYIQKLEGKENEREQEKTRKQARSNWRRSVGFYIIAVGVSVSALRSQTLRMVFPGGIFFQNSSARAQTDEDEKRKYMKNQKDWWEGSGF